MDWRIYDCEYWNIVLQIIKVAKRSNYYRTNEEYISIDVLFDFARSDIAVMACRGAPTEGIA